ncbi:MAG: amino acid adenylation domain-containing protein [Polyangia bacterium]
MQGRTLSDAEREQVLQGWNSAVADYSPGSCLHHLLEAQAALRPDAVALDGGDVQLSYAALNRRASRLARLLRARGIGPGARVSLCMARSPELIVAMFAVLKAGGAYVPVSPAYPQSRIRFMLTDCGAALLLTQAALRERLPETTAAVLAIEDIERELEPEPEPLAAADPGFAVAPTDVAYVIYTSGSTGTPKGVLVEHRGTYNTAAAHIALLGLRPTDRLLQFAATSFDSSVLEIMMALGAGATLVLIPQEQLVVGEALARFLAEREITVAQLQPSVLASLPERELPALRIVISAGEACTAPLVARWSRGRELWNAYGPTEASVCVTLGRCTADGRTPAIGRPLPNTRVYILDDAQQPVAIGEPGELYLGGVAVARGYLNRPELTAQRFLEDPFSPQPGARMYRTGDLGRFRDSGEIDFIGRVDQQIKLRGFRIELGEIEAAILRHPGIAMCAVIVREDEPGDRRLVAYVVAAPGASLSTARLRRALAAELPEFMVPAALVTMVRLPLSAHGKVDHRALPPPGRARPEVATEYEAPHSETERALIATFSQVLHIDEIGVHDDFFELGGHSLQAAQAVAQTALLLRIELPLRALFEHRSARALARYIEATAPALEPASIIPRAPRDQPLPLSYSQQQVWLTSRIEASCPLYNEPYAVTVRGPLDPDALEAALADLIERHEILRTGFEEEAGVPVQRVHAAVPLAMERDDLSELAARAPDAAQAALRRLADAQAQQAFDLRTPPLLRAQLVRLGPHEHQLLLTLHRAIFDGVSLVGVLLPELVARYRAHAGELPAGAAELPAPVLQYADYAAWERRALNAEVLAPHLAYWRRQLADLPALQLPTDHPRPARGSFRGARLPLHLPPALADGLGALAQREGATLYMALLASFAALLHRYTGQEDLAVAGVVSLQDRPQLQGLVGPFVNTVVLRVDLSEAPSFRTLLRRTRETVLSAVSHRELPFERLVEALRPERRLGQHPLFQVLFLLDPPGPELGRGFSASRFGAHNGTAMCDLSLQLDRRADGLVGFFEYSTDLFEAATIARWARHLENLIAAAVAAPESPMLAAPLLPREERGQLTAWSGGAQEFPVHECLHERFAAQAASTPDAVAALCDGQQLTYAELEARSNTLARRLRSLGVGPDVLVGLCVERSLELVVGILGILKAGGAYVPLDPVYPRDRLRFLLTDTATPVLVTQSKLVPSLPSFTGALVCIDQLEAGAPAAPAASDEPPSEVRPHHLAYVIYTSGSTGRPKGVRVTHGNVVRLFLATDAWFGFDASDVWCLFHSFAFDFSVWELWGALLYGGRLVVVPYWVSRSPEAFYRLLCREGVTVLNQTPSAFYQLVQAEPHVAAELGPSATAPALALRHVIFGGEALDLGALRPWFERHGDVRPRLINMYGITETTVHVTYYPITAADCEQPGSIIGVPIPDLRARVLDRRLQPVPIGIPGELFVGGAGVAMGYLNRPELSAERFIADPLGAPGDRLYRSGDWVRYRPDGNLEYLGRIDQQIKIRGFRIELGEIEEALGQHPEVQAAVVTLRADTPSDKRLVAYVVPRSAAGEPGLPSRLRASLEQKLPSYMVPAHLITLSELPLTPNGKVDRRALPAPDQSRPELRAEYVAPRTYIEEELAAIFSEVLGVEKVGVNDSFFELGGHSLLVTRALFRVRDVFHVELPMRAVFEAPTLAGLARHLELLQPGRGGRSVPAIVHTPPDRREGRLPLSFAQQRLWFLGRLLPDAPSYNEPVTIRFRGAVDVPALERALGEILRRHEAWRTTFQAQDGEPFQVIHPPVPFKLKAVDLRELTPEAREAEFLRLCSHQAHLPFDLAEGPLLRFQLLLLAPDDTRLFMTFHHVVADGLSIYSVFSVELAKLYQAMSGGRPSPLPELPIQYVDFALWQRRFLTSEIVERQLAYWKQQLGPNLPTLQLPLDHTPPQQPTFRGARQILSVPLELTQKLRRLAHREGATLFIALLTALKALFFRYIEQSDIVVGIVTAGRQRPELAPLCGFFPNTLVLRTQLAGGLTFRQLLRRVREVALQAFDNQDVPFERIVEALNPERRPGETPLFRVGFILDPPTPPLGVDWEMTSLDVELDAAKFDISLELVEVPHGLVGRISYRTELFEPLRMQRMARHYVTLLESATEAPDQPVALMPLLCTDEHARLLAAACTTAPFPDVTTVHVLFEAQVDAAPESPALRYLDTDTSYRELDVAANRVAHALRRRGLGPGSLVALCVERSPLLCAGLLGILKAGAAFVPLDPAYPRDRLALMLRDSAAPLLLSESRLLERLPEPRQETICLDDESWQKAEPAERPPRAATPTDLCYVIYTSGSTGRPKGVLIEHRGVCNLAAAQAQTFALDAYSRVLQFASPSFDASVFEICMALLHGCTLVLAPREQTLPGPELIELLIGQRIDTLTITPSVLAALPPAELPELRTLIVAGEACPAELVARWAPGRIMWNAYGPTEATVWTTVARCEPSELQPPIGRPIQNAAVYILDPNLQLVPEDVAGEICIGGVGVARGYLGRPELTAERFVRDPFSADPQARLYRTGDLGRWRADGQLEFLGRLDDQVKVRGVRIEPAEIESALRACPGVRDAAVVVAVQPDGSRELVGYFVPAAEPGAGEGAGEGGSPGEPALAEATAGPQLRAQLQQLLPDYMLPTVFVPVAELPQTPNGKVDRGQLARRALMRPRSTAAFEPASTPLESQLVAIWSEVLGVERIGVNDSFFDLGGHSLRMAQVHARLRELLQRDVPLLVLFQYPTISALARYLQGDANQESQKLLRSQERGRRQKEALSLQRQRAQGQGKVRRDD